MNNLRRAIRKILLESTFEKMELEQMWADPDDGIPRKNWGVGKLRSTHHRDSFNKNIDFLAKRRMDAIGTQDEYFQDRRDLKRMWNQAVDNGGHRDFWEKSGKVKYFHSLEYYGGDETDTLVTNARDDGEIRNLSIKAFFDKYSPRNNKDEMSTWGVYKGKSKATEGKHRFGFLLKGRVTYASYNDLYTESRSKTTSVDMERHKGSGLPKRPGLYRFVEEDVVIGEDDLRYSEVPLGECVLDNWAIDAIVVSKMTGRYNQIIKDPELMKIIEYYGIRFVEPKDIFRRG